METDTRKRLWVLGTLLLVLGLGVRAAIAYFSPSVYWPDEIYQTLEPAHRLLFGHGRVKWEYQEGLRSWVFPGLLAAVMWVGQIFGEGSRGYIGATTVFLSVVSLVPAVATYLWSRRSFEGSWWPVVAMVFPLVWFEAIYFGPKSLYESFTIHVVIAGIFLVRFADETWLRPLIGGLLIGVCVITRPHLALVPIAIGLAVPLTAERPQRVFTALVVGVVGGAGIAGIVDVIAYGVPFHSLIVNLHTNVIEGKASQWGTSPWWQFFVWAWEVSRLGSVVMAAALLAGIVRYPMLAWPALLILGAHCFIPHKEYRFLYPVVVFGSMIVGLDAVHLSRWIGDTFEFDRARLFVVSLFLVFWTAASVSGALEFRLSSTGQKQENLNWTSSQGALLAYRYLSTQDICGLGRVAFWEICTGGYSYLHHDIEVVPLDGPEAVRNKKSRFDAFLARDWDREAFAGFTRDRCFREFCVYRRDGACQ